ncbi:MAG: PepSY-associated TM helix domain-containing protein [Prevotellaceae bacterium]|jgi:hypothetical protein|nr:PepSY-associated TM helix domain-containing protein [Prevotellaceae bacterium]
MKFTRLLRIVHRDLGFAVVGVSLVYGISGIYLNHLDGKDPAYRTEERSLQLSAGLDEKQLADAWNADAELPPLKRVFRIDEDHFRLMLDGGVAVYNSADGRADYERHTRREFVYWINRLHYNKVKGWSPVADFFAGSVLFLAVSGMFIVRGKAGLAGRGKWYLLGGLLVPVLWVLIGG